MRRGGSIPLPSPHLSLLSIVQTSHKAATENRSKGSKRRIQSWQKALYITIAGINIKHIQKPNFRNITVHFLSCNTREDYKSRRLFGMMYTVRVCVVLCTYTIHSIQPFICLIFSLWNVHTVTVVHCTHSICAQWNHQNYTKPGKLVKSFIC
jgi:hypothetical protein